MAWQPKENTLKNLVGNRKGSSFLVAFYQNTSNHGPGVEISPVLWVLGFHIKIKKENFKNLLVPNRKG